MSTFTSNWFLNVGMVKAVFDTAGKDSSGVSNKTIAAHPLTVKVPDDVVIIGGFIDIITTFASAGADAGTIALHVQGADDLVAAIAIATGTIWDAGVHGVLPGNFALDGSALSAIAMAAAKAASQIKTTAEREITATVVGQLLTAGKLNLYLFYLPSNVVV